MSGTPSTIGGRSSFGRPFDRLKASSRQAQDGVRLLKGDNRKTLSPWRGGIDSRGLFRHYCCCNQSQEAALSHEYEAAQTLRESGHRLTPQRLMILAVLRHTERHLTAGEILAQVKGTYPFVDASTVYRTLAVLKEMRLVSEANLGGSEAVFEWIDATERHHHLICRQCRREAVLDQRYLDDLGAAILDDHGFQADVDHIVIFGLCGRCRSRGARGYPGG